jgi:hypothetical protein
MISIYSINELEYEEEAQLFGIPRTYETYKTEINGKMGFYKEKI